MISSDLVDVDLIDIDTFSQGAPDDYHAVVTVQLVELINSGVVDFDSNYWNFDYYNIEQRNRLYEKIRGRFDYREIGILPIKKWHDRFIAKLNEIMPKYKPLYKALEEGYTPLQSSSEAGKSRSIFSDFPQTMLGDNQDYASNGTDREYEIIRMGDLIETAEKLKNYSDVDAMILDELDSLFSSLLTVNLNAY